MYVNLQVLRQLFEIFFNLQIQKRIVVATTIRGNTVFQNSPQFGILKIRAFHSIVLLPLSARALRAAALVN